MSMEFEGIQYIGDPHASSRRPGRRREGYAASVLAKLKECAQASHEHKLLTIILGDLFHTAGENDLSLLNKLSRVLRSFYSPVYIVVGNHDRGKFSLADDDALTFIFEGRAAFPLDVLDASIQGTSVRIQGIGHGVALPKSVDRGTAEVFNLVTHHDLAFGSAYPGALPLEEIQGVDFVVNGHMHDTKKSVVTGSTVWHNPGNIEPISVDLRDHVPAFWVWRSGQPQHALQKYPLQHDFDCFDLTGLLVEAADPLQSVQALDMPTPEMQVESEATNVDTGGVTLGPKRYASEFANQMMPQDALSADKTDDASVLVEDVAAVLGLAAVSPATAALLQKLLVRVKAESE